MIDCSWFFCLFSFSFERKIKRDSIRTDSQSAINLTMLKSFHYYYSELESVLCCLDHASRFLCFWNGFPSGSFGFWAVLNMNWLNLNEPDDSIQVLEPSKRLTQLEWDALIWNWIIEMAMQVTRNSDCMETKRTWLTRITANRVASCSCGEFNQADIAVAGESDAA